jgi:hypothetical protein
LLLEINFNTFEKKIILRKLEKYKTEFKNAKIESSGLIDTSSYDKMIKEYETKLNTIITELNREEKKRF